MNTQGIWNEIPGLEATATEKPNESDTLGWIYELHTVYTGAMGKHLVDIDEAALAAAQAELGTASMKDTVNEALRRATVRRSARVQKALDRLGGRRLPPREEAWR